jgi:Mrp family chromosome partitioning ATPase
VLPVRDARADEDEDADHVVDDSFEHSTTPQPTRQFRGRLATPILDADQVKTTVGPLPGAPSAAPAPTPAPAASPPPVTALAPVASAAMVPMSSRTEVSVFKLDRSTSIDTRLVMVREPDSPRAAAYRVLRHRLLERDRRTFVVTSAQPGEGKTTCAANLALALGECGRAKVLLVEANLRTPALAAMLGFQPPVCFSEQLAAHRDRPLEPWTLVEVLSPYLHVAAVKPGGSGRPLVDAPAWAIAMERLKLAGYDYIVIDTPAVLGAADVNLIQDSADAVFFVARARTSSGRHLRRAVEQLAPAPILGVVVIE